MLPGNFKLRKCISIKYIYTPTNSLVSEFCFNFSKVCYPIEVLLNMVSEVVEHKTIQLLFAKCSLSSEFPSRMKKYNEMKTELK